MEISPEAFRQVEFREKRHGYHPEDVDKFLEQMAVAAEDMRRRMLQAQERAQRAEDAAAEAGRNDEALRRTLVLGQRTADEAVEQARTEAARILASAEQRSEATIADADLRARRMLDEALAQMNVALATVEATRVQAQHEVDALTRWVTEHRLHLTATMREAIALIDGAEVLSPPPSSTRVDLLDAIPGSGPRQEPTAATSVLTPATPGEGGGPVTAEEGESPVPVDGPQRPVTSQPSGLVTVDGPQRPGTSEHSGRSATAGSETGSSSMGWRPDAASGEPAEGSGDEIRLDDTPAPRGAEPAGAGDEAAETAFGSEDFDDDPRFSGRLRRRG